MSPTFDTTKPLESQINPSLDGYGWLTLLSVDEKLG
jgi:hypothetical protein